MKANRTTDEMKLALLRDRLMEKREAGLLGVVAARAAVNEGELHDWCTDARKVPMRSVVEDVSKVIAREHYTDAALESSQLSLIEDDTGFDPYNNLPALLRRQAS